MTLLQPVMLWGTLLVLVPLLLHLMFAQPRRRVPWSAMRFLLVAMEQDRRRVRFRQLTLLILRMLSLLLLFVMLAQPVVSGGRGFTRRLGAERRLHQFVIDDSLSMQTKTESGTFWQRGRDVLERFVRQLPAGDEVTIRRTSAPEHAVVERQPAGEVADWLVDQLGEPTDIVASWARRRRCLAR